MFYLGSLGRGFGVSWVIFGPKWLRLLSLLGGGSIVVDSLFIDALIVCGGSVFGPCSVEQCLMSFLVCDPLDGEERAEYLTLFVFLMICDSLFSGLQCLIVVFTDRA